MNDAIKPEEAQAIEKIAVILAAHLFQEAARVKGPGDRIQDAAGNFEKTAHIRAGKIDVIVEKKGIPDPVVIGPVTD